MTNKSISELFETARTVPNEISLSGVERIIDGIPGLLLALPWWKTLTLKSNLMISVGTLTVASGLTLLTISQQSDADANMPLYEPRVAEPVALLIEEEDDRLEFPQYEDAVAEIADAAETVRTVMEEAPVPVERTVQLVLKPLVPIQAAPAPALAKNPEPASFLEAPDKDFSASGFTGISLSGFVGSDHYEGRLQRESGRRCEMIENLLIEVQKNTLAIKSKKKKYKSKKKRSVTVTVSMPTIDHLDISGFRRCENEWLHVLEFLGPGPQRLWQLYREWPSEHFRKDLH